MAAWPWVLPLPEPAPGPLPDDVVPAGDPPPYLLPRPKQKPPGRRLGPALLSSWLCPPLASPGPCFGLLQARVLRESSVNFTSRQ